MDSAARCGRPPSLGPLGIPHPTKQHGLIDLQLRLTVTSWSYPLTQTSHRSRHSLNSVMAILSSRPRSQIRPTMDNNWYLIITNTKVSASILCHFLNFNFGHSTSDTISLKTVLLRPSPIRDSQVNPNGCETKRKPNSRLHRSSNMDLEIVRSSMLDLAGGPRPPWIPPWGNNHVVPPTKEDPLGWSPRLAKNTPENGAMLRFLRGASLLLRSFFRLKPSPCF